VQLSRQGRRERCRGGAHIRMDHTSSLVRPRHTVLHPVDGEHARPELGEHIRGHEGLCGALPGVKPGVQRRGLGLGLGADAGDDFGDGEGLSDDACRHY
jgi:hypothetical protein